MRMAAGFDATHVQTFLRYAMSGLSMLERIDLDGVLSLGSICISSEGVFAETANRPSGVVRKSQIECIGVRCGSRVRHPFFLGLFGIALIGLGVLPLVHIALCLARGNEFMPKEALLLIWLFVGAAAFWQALQRGCALEVKTATGLRTFEFAKGIDSSEATSFLEQAEKKFGYVIE